MRVTFISSMPGSRSPSRIRATRSCVKDLGLAVLIVAFFFCSSHLLSSHFFFFFSVPKCNRDPGALVSRPSFPPSPLRHVPSFFVARRLQHFLPSWTRINSRKLLFFSCRNNQPVWNYCCTSCCLPPPCSLQHPPMCRRQMPDALEVEFFFFLQ